MPQTTMIPPISGIHHVTALASDPQRNAEFYTDVLGLRLVKRTVNFDAPTVYHLYYGDLVGTPGTILTFFPFPNAAQGKRGSGETQAVAYRVGQRSIDYWVHRLASKGIGFEGPSDRFGDQVLTFLDPDGLRLELMFTAGRPASVWAKAPVPAEHALRGFAGVTMAYLHDEIPRAFLTAPMGFAQGPSAGARSRFFAGSGDDRVAVDVLRLKDITPARQSAGSVHHIAWRVPDDDTQQQWRAHLIDGGAMPTEVIDRKYFRSIYFREPGGVLFEIATDGPGFGVDEPVEELGTRLVLPSWYEADRERIERSLIPIRL